MADKKDKSLTSRTALAGAAIGSAAVAAALLYASRRKDRKKSATVYIPPHPQGTSGND